MRGYTRVKWEIVVASDDAESVIESVNAALDRLEETTTVYDSEVDQEQAGEPANASEIASGH